MARPSRSSAHRGQSALHGQSRRVSDRGAHHRQSQGEEWVLQGGVADIESAIPESVRQLIERQIDRLTAERAPCARSASVVGSSARAVADRRRTREPTDLVDERCEALVRRHQFLLPARLRGVAGRNDHASLQVQSTSSISRCRINCCRPCGHKSIGGSASGERIYGRRVDDIAAELAMHFEQGNDAPRAVRYLLMAAENARHRSANYEVEALARRGLLALAMLAPSRERDQQELSLRMLLGVSVMSLKEFAADEVKEIYARALELCREQTTSPDAFIAQWFLGLFHYFRADMPLCHEIARELRRSCGHAGRSAAVHRSGVRVRRHALGLGQVRRGARRVRQGRLSVRNAARPSNEGIRRTGSRGHERVLCGQGTVGSRLSQSGHRPHQPGAGAGPSGLANRDPGDSRRYLPRTCTNFVARFALHKMPRRVRSHSPTTTGCPCGRPCPASFWAGRVSSRVRSRTGPTNCAAGSPPTRRPGRDSGERSHWASSPRL